MKGSRSARASGTADLPTCCSSIAVASQAASICFVSMPASVRASSNASTIRSSASMSQRSPNFEQPIPRMATLSLMPRAIVSSLRRDRRRLPEVAPKAALRVDVLDAEHHAHALAALEAPRIDVGEIHHGPPARLELHHAV